MILRLFFTLKLPSKHVNTVENLEMWFHTHTHIFAIRKFLEPKKYNENNLYAFSVECLAMKPHITTVKLLSSRSFAYGIACSLRQLFNKPIAMKEMSFNDTSQSSDQVTESNKTRKTFICLSFGRTNMWSAEV
jgi:hypothetical protein